MFCCSPANLGWGGTREGEHLKNLIFFISDPPRPFDNSPFLGWDYSLCHHRPVSSFFVSFPLTPAVRRWKGDGGWENMCMKSIPAILGADAAGGQEIVSCSSNQNDRTATEPFGTPTQCIEKGLLRQRPELCWNTSCPSQHNSTARASSTCPASCHTFPCWAFDVAQDKRTQQLPEIFTHSLQHQRTC